MTLCIHFVAIGNELEERRCYLIVVKNLLITKEE